MVFDRSRTVQSADGRRLLRIVARGWARADGDEARLGGGRSSRHGGVGLRLDGGSGGSSSRGGVGRTMRVVGEDDRLLLLLAAADRANASDAARTSMLLLLQIVDDHFTLARGTHAATRTLWLNSGLAVICLLYTSPSPRDS